MVINWREKGDNYLDTRRDQDNQWEEKTLSDRCRICPATNTFSEPTLINVLYHAEQLARERHNHELVLTASDKECSTCRC